MVTADEVVDRELEVETLRLGISRAWRRVVFQSRARLWGLYHAEQTSVGRLNEVKKPSSQARQRSGAELPSEQLPTAETHPAPEPGAVRGHDTSIVRSGGGLRGLRTTGATTCGAQVGQPDSTSVADERLGVRLRPLPDVTQRPSLGQPSEPRRPASRMVPDCLEARGGEKRRLAQGW